MCQPQKKYVSVFTVLKGKKAQHSADEMKNVLNN